MHKPSILWPPPTNVVSDSVRQNIRSRLRRVTGLDDQNRLKSFLGSIGRGHLPKDGGTTSEGVVDTGRSTGFGTSTLAPSAAEGHDQRIVLQAESGETLNVDSQIQ